MARMGHHISDYKDAAREMRMANPTSEEKKIFTSAETIAVPVRAIEQLRGRLMSDKKGRARKDQIRAAVSPICEEARRSSAMPEQLLVLIKEVCHSIPEYGTMRGAVERGLFLDTVVSVAIEEFYRA